MYDEVGSVTVHDQLPPASPVSVKTGWVGSAPVGPVTTGIAGGSASSRYVTVVGALS